MKLSREELMMEKVNSWRKRQKWVPSIYIIVLLFWVAVPAVLTNYSEGLLERLPLLIDFLFVVTGMALFYGICLTITYTYVDSRDGKAFQCILVSVCYIPFSIEKWAEWMKRIVIKKMKLVGAVTFLILVAGMFVGEYTDERLGIGFYLPENVFQSLAVCIVGTLWVMAFIYIGYAISKTTVLKQYQKKRYGGKTILFE